MTDFLRATLQVLGLGFVFIMAALAYAWWSGRRSRKRYLDGQKDWEGGR